MKTKDFLRQLEKCNLILTQLGCVEDFICYPQKIVNPASTFKGMPYIEVWKYIYREKAANFVLFDFSLLIFDYSQENKKYSISYYDNPYPFVDDYIFFNQYPGTNYDDYKQYLKDERTPKESVCYIRYDYDPDSYNIGIHPAAHLHIGHNNNIRIGCHYKLTPLLFLSLIMRQCYPSLWKRLIENKFFGINIKYGVQDIDSCHFNAEDEIEMYLHSRSIQISKHAFPL